MYVRWHLAALSIKLVSRDEQDRANSYAPLQTDGKT